MKIRTKLTNLGFEISFGDEDPTTLEPSPDANQERPRGHYVYAHVDAAGQMFYIGKGAEQRAWSKDRHPLWHRYVEKHLGGTYSVRILRDNLSLEDSEVLEADWIAQCSDTLVNWVNMGRPTDFEAIAEFHRLRNANRTLMQTARAAEKTDLAAAANMYVQAIEAIRAYAFITSDGGLVGQLLAEEAAESGINGDIEALDRLSICLVKLGRVDEAARHVESYFAVYRRDLDFSAALRISKRIEKARAANQSPSGTRRGSERA